MTLGSLVALQSGRYNQALMSLLVRTLLLDSGLVLAKLGDSTAKDLIQVNYWSIAK